MKNISTFDFQDKKVLIRVDFNVPLNSNLEVTDITRIEAALPTINKVLSNGGAVILMSHLGRPKDAFDGKFSLKHTLPVLEKLLGTSVKFATDCIGDNVKKMTKQLKKGEVLLLENLRFHKEEKKGDEAFAEELSTFADIYINDAFATAHRAHASTTIIAKYFSTNKMFGYIIESELKSLDAVLKNPKNPYTAIIGGAKVSTKIIVIEQLLEKIDNLIIGGGMIFTFIKANGGKIGNSLVENDYLSTALKIMKKAEEKNVKIHLPIDVDIAKEFSNDAERKQGVDIYNIPDGFIGLDIGEKTIKQFEKVIKSSKTLLWNGPMGVFEFSNFVDGTKKTGLAIAEATENGAFSLAGGGDSVAAVNKFKLKEKISYISTAGGAMLEYLEGKKLPGIMAIK